MPPIQPITDLATAVTTAFALALSMIFAAIPPILGFLAIVIIGWIIAGILAAIVVRLLRAVRFNELSERAGFARFVRNMGVQMDPAALLAETAKWFVRLIVLIVAFDALGLPAVSDTLDEILAWLPNLVVAIVVLVIGGVIASVLSDLVRGSTATAGLGDPNLMATIARYAVWAFAIVVAVNQLGIATTLINTLFMATVGAIALALGLAFGLGGRETAAQLWQDWYERGREMAPRLREAAAAASTSEAYQPARMESHPMRRATDRGEPESPGPHPMRRSTDLVTP